MKYKIITIGDNTNTIGTNRFIRTFEKYVTNAELQIISFNPKIENEYVIKHINSRYAGHINRFLLLNEFDLIDNETYIVLDLHDVIFQCDLPEINFGCYDVFASSEDEKWYENSFFHNIVKNSNFVKKILDKTVFCSGTFAAKGETIKDLVKFFSDNVKFYNSRFNQPFFNLWLTTKKVANTNLFGTLHANIDTGKIKLSEGKFYDNENNLIPIIHANGSYDKYLTH